MINVTMNEVQKIVEESAEELFTKDKCLLENNVSERAITHKLAEYLQLRISYLNVDCEYNRNAEKGHNVPKEIVVLREETKAINTEGFDESEWLAISTYPDIIVHRRMTNEANLLVVEVKKGDSKVPHKHDLNKLKAFTEKSAQNDYNFRYGVFIVLGMDEQLLDLRMRWFIDGQEVTHKFRSRNVTSL